MRRPKPPVNQRKLNEAIRASKEHRYRDWYSMFLALEKAGKTYSEIVDDYAELGVVISTATLQKWVRVRERYGRNKTKNAA